MGSACQAGQSLSRELIAVGGGRIFAWESDTGLYQLYRIGVDTPLGEGPLSDKSDGYPANTNGSFYAVAPSRLLQTSPLTTGFSVVPLFDVPNERVLGPFLVTSSWPEPFWGHEVIALDDDHILKWWLGTGDYSVYLYDRAHESTQPLVLTSASGSLPDLRRGARVVNLGEHRLLVWTPKLGTFAVWPYDLTGEGGGIFGDKPVAQGTWTNPGIGDDILVSDVDPAISPTGRVILVWERATGRVSLRVLDPTAADPMDGPLISERVYPNLVHPDWVPHAQSLVSNAEYVLQRGRSFDSYFGQYCTAAPGSNPSCEDGPACCEREPSTIPGAPACTPLDTSHDAYTPDASIACMTSKMDGRLMDAFADASTPPGCGDPRSFVCAGVGASAGSVGVYQDYAARGAIADHVFQSALDPDATKAVIYLNKTAYGLSISTEAGQAITELLADAHVRWAIYLQSPMRVLVEYGQIPPQFYDPHWTFFRGLDELPRDIELEQLPDVSIVISGSHQTEQPGDGPPNVGIEFVKGLVDALMQSPLYSQQALTVVTHLTTGGFYDHVPPPQPLPVAVDVETSDSGAMEPVPYGMRVPFIALGPFVRQGAISHAQLELSSLAVFLEWNWLGPEQVGRLHHRDGAVANLGSLLDDSKTGASVPAGVKGP
jgi:hypothetical protein